jgi:hypothetical protein
MCVDQDIPQDLQDEIANLLDRLSADPIEEREAAAAALRVVILRLWRSGSDQYARVIKLLKAKLRRANAEVIVGISVAIGAAGIDFSDVKQEYLGGDRGDIVFEYEIKLNDTNRDKVFDVDLYFGDEQENAYYPSAKIVPVNEVGANTWPSGNQRWRSDTKDGKLVLRGETPLGAGSYHFKVIVEHVKKPKDGKAQDTVVDIVATDENGAPLLESRAKVKVPKFPSSK